MSKKYDTFWPRFEAGLWDALIFLPLGFLNAYIQDNVPPTILIFWDIIYVLSRPVYTIWMHGKYGQTVGKFKTGIILLNISERRAINYRESIIRESPYLIMIFIYLGLTIKYSFFNVDNLHYETSTVYTISAYAIWIWLLLELLTMFSNEKRRALHDYLANSFVVRTAFMEKDN